MDDWHLVVSKPCKSRGMNAVGGNCSSSDRVKPGTQVEMPSPYHIGGAAFTASISSNLLVED